MSTDGWLETYRGVVYRWELDHNDHLTVAYYFSRLADAGLGLVRALGLERPGAGEPAWVTADCYVRFLHELRVGDMIHMETAPIAVEPDGLVAGHRLLNSETGAVTTTFEQRLRAVGAGEHPLALSPAERERLEACRCAWDGPPRPERRRPPTLAGFRDSARDVVKPSEADPAGRASLTAYIHRFSAAVSHVLAAFGMTPSYQRDQHRGFSTFEFQLSIAGTVRPGDGVVVRSGLLHVGTSSIHILHVMCDARTGQEVAALHQLGAHLDLDARRSTALPRALADQARTLLVPGKT